jgi:hypothetical protein
MDARHLAFLDSLKSVEFAHVSRKARDHLLGVYDILAGWGCPPDTCVAGLFHNIYGTESFKPQAISLNERREVIAVIGESAESLAYWFCVSRRVSFFARQSGAAPCIWDEVHKTRVTVSALQLEALIDIEAANLVEQYDEQMQNHSTRLGQSVAMIRWMLAQPAAISPPARESLTELLQMIDRDRRARTASVVS